jgi:hypothetical protein
MIGTPLIDIALHKDQDWNIQESVESSFEEDCENIGRLLRKGVCRLAGGWGARGDIAHAGTAV